MYRYVQGCSAHKNSPKHVTAIDGFASPNAQKGVFLEKDSSLWDWHPFARGVSK
jgi:hypothetical protein